MGEYLIIVSATSNATANTEDTAIEVDQPASVALEVLGVEITFTQSAAVADNNYRARLVSKTVAGTGGASGTMRKVRDNSVAADSTTTIKSGTTAFTLGTIGNEYKRWGFNERAGLFYVCPTPIMMPAGDLIAVLLQCTVASRDFTAILHVRE